MAFSNEDGAVFWQFAPELVYAIASFLGGKGLCSLLESLLSCKGKRSHFYSLTHYIMRRCEHDTLHRLSHLPLTPQPALVAFVQDSMIPRSEALKQVMIIHHNQPQNPFITATSTSDALFIRQLSEWCILLEYVLLGFRHASTLSSMNEDPTTTTTKQQQQQGMLWPIGVGVFATSPVCGGNIPLQTKVIVSCPVWDPTAVILCHDVWLYQKSTKPSSLELRQLKVVGAPTHFSWLPSEGDIDGFVPTENIGLLTPYDETNLRTFLATKALTRDDDFLPAMGRPDSCLSILPAGDCPIYGSVIDHMVRSSSSHGWMLDHKGQGCRNLPQMLCFFDCGPKYPESAGQNYSTSLLVDRVFSLMKSLEDSLSIR